MSSASPDDGFSLQDVPGVGPKVKKLLLTHKITTVEQLANSPPTRLSIPNFHNLVQNAKNLLASADHKEEDTKSETRGPTVTLGAPPPQTPVEQPPDTKQALSNTLDERYLIKDHNWFECMVRVPSENDYLIDMVVYEMSVEPTHRVAFMCAYTENSELVTDSFSGQLLAHFNPELPMLHVTINSEDFSALKNRFAVENTIKEINQILSTIATPTNY